MIKPLLAALTDGFTCKVRFLHSCHVPFRIGFFLFFCPLVAINRNQLQCSKTSNNFQACSTLSLVTFYIEEIQNKTRFEHKKNMLCILQTHFISISWAFKRRKTSDSKKTLTKNEIWGIKRNITVATFDSGVVSTCIYKYCRARKNIIKFNVRFKQ